MVSRNLANTNNQLAKIFKPIFFCFPQAPKITLYLFLIIGFSLLVHILCMTSTVLIVEEAYYWNYAQHLDFSYLDHPPMVALLIKLSTLIFGTNEFGVRMTSLICWVLMAFFSFRLTHLINKGAGPYVLMLLAILPFFFLQALVITPDIPLLVCWAASLYCLYRSLILNQSNYWYAAGIWLGLGMLSKYTISLLGLATLFYVITIPSARSWLRRKEPYICALIAMFIFTPVIYWNATHGWVSFIFQSSRRFNSISSTSLHHLLGLSFIFLTPLGVLGFWELMKKNIVDKCNISDNSKHFILIFTWFPWGVFALFSFNHQIKFNWIGPIYLAFIPWLASLMANITRKRTLWIKTSILLLVGYSAILLLANFNKSERIQQKIFKDLIAWNTLTKQFHELASHIETQTKLRPTFVPLDTYHIGSELAFYQAKALNQGTITRAYPIVGAHIFGENSLMYRYWSKKEDYFGKPLILISPNARSFENPELRKQVIEQSQLNKIEAVSQGQGIPSTPYYYKVVQMKE